MKNELVNSLIIWITFFLSIVGITGFGLHFFHSSNTFLTTFPAVLTNWDGGYYLSIAEHGYQNARDFAFLPLYPLLIYAVNILIDNYVYSSLLISWSCGILAIYYFRKLAEYLLGTSKGNLALISLLVFPTSFILITSYTESLFLALSISSFYYLLSKKNIPLAILLAALSTITRISGLIFLVALLIELYDQGLLKKYWYAMLAILPLILFILYLQLAYGDWTFFFQAEKYWNRELGVSGLNIFGYINNYIHNVWRGDPFVNLIEFISLIFGIGMFIRIIHTSRLSFKVYTGGWLLVILLSGSLMSMPRFLLVLFPLFLILPDVRWLKIYWFVCAVLLVIFTIRFMNGYWIS